MASILTPNMSLILPTIGEELSPTWAQDINSSLSILDQHDHSPGSGAPIVPAGININTDLPFNNHNLTLIRSSRFNPQTSPINLGSDIGCLYVAGVDLYFNDVNGNQVRITQSGAVAGTPGSITNLVSPASVTYVSATPAFVFESDVNTAANLDAGSITLRNITPNSTFGVQINAPAALGNNYSVTFPSALPGSTLPLSISNSGNLSAAQIITAQIGDLQVTTAKLADASVTSDKLDTDLEISGTFTAQEIDIGTVTLIQDGAFLLSNSGIQFTANTKAAVGSFGDDRTLVAYSNLGVSLPIVTSAAPSTHGLKIIRGELSAGGTPGTGEGFTAVRNSLGNYTITFTTPFSDTPVITFVGIGNNVTYNVQTINSTTVNFLSSVFGPGLTDSALFFIAIGQR